MKLVAYIGRAAPLVAIGQNQCRMLEFCVKYPGWHSFKQDRATIAAVNGLKRRGCVDISGDQFRLAKA